MFYLWIALAFVIGGFMGILGTCLCIAAKRNETHAELTAKVVKS